MSLPRLRPRFTLLTPVALVGLAASLNLIWKGHYLLGPLTLLLGLVLLYEEQRLAGTLAALQPCRFCQGRGWRVKEGGLAPQVCSRCGGVHRRPLDPARVRGLSEQDLALVDLIVAAGGSSYDVVMFKELGTASHREREAIEDRLLGLVDAGLLDRHWRELAGDKPLDAGELYVARPDQVELLKHERARRAQALLPGNRSRLSPLAGGRP